MNDTVGVDIECYFDLRDSSGCGSDAVQTEHTELLVILSEFTLALEDVDINGSLVISRSGEYHCVLYRNSLVSLDHLCANAAHSLDTERKGSYITENHACYIACEYTALESCTESNALIGVDALEGILAHEVLDSFLNSGDS